ncbi:M24 family metallopeptidase [Saccharopolyspora sp. 5N708]|uniref:M24 family metallopeptidase n=1 Tax=Saccharopolyspora sp. 5N708 TaxID=3457424 RepID=UPI003FD1E423
MTRTELSERLNHPVSTAELRRRWAAIREGMAARGLDVLVAQTDNDYVGGYIRYLTDVPATNGYPVTVVFPREEPMTIIRHGARGEDLEIDPEHDPVLRGVGRVLASPYMSSVPYTRYDGAELALDALRPFTTGSVGWVGTGTIPMAFGEYLQRELHAATFTEAADVVDTVRAVKSEEELSLIRATAKLQDAAVAAAFEALQPGMRDSDVAAVAQHTAQSLGSEQGIYWCVSTPLGEPGRIAHPHSQHRVIREGDAFHLMVEVNGPGGMYTEIGRSGIVGKIPARIAEEYEFCLQAQRFCYDLLRPGAAPADVWAEYNQYLRDNGRPEELRLHCHGQGTDLVERPLIRAEEPMPLAAGMNIACHPRYVLDGFCHWVCDNVIIGDDGVAELHEFDKRLAEFG